MPQSSPRPDRGVPRRPSPSIRPRDESDLDACVRVLAEVHRRDGYPLNWPARPEAWVAQAASLGAWVAELDGRLIGHVGLSRGGEGDMAPGLWSDRNGVAPERTAVLSRLFVAPGARGHGVGAHLVGRAVREARRRGLHPVLDVVASDTAAAALYERLGWERLATVEQRWSPHRTVTVHCYAAAPAAIGAESQNPDRPATAREA